MICDDVLSCLKSIKNSSISNILLNNNINIKISDNIKHMALISFANNTTYIYLQNHDHVINNPFIILHELGHYFCNIRNGTYLFKGSFNASRSELKANLFACLYLLQSFDYSKSNSITDYLINNGCPHNIAYNAFEYLQRNNIIPQNEIY